MQKSIRFTLLTVTFNSHVVCQLDVGQVAPYLGFIAMGMSCSMLLHSVRASYQVVLLFGLLLSQVPDVHGVDHFLWREETRSVTRNH